MSTDDSKIVDSKVYELSGLFSDKFNVDFYRREYVWQYKQMKGLSNKTFESLQNPETIE